MDTYVVRKRACEYIHMHARAPSPLAIHEWEREKERYMYRETVTEKRYQK